MANWFPQIDHTQCTGCEDCVRSCPTGALQMITQKAELALPEMCSYCAICEDICPTSAIALPYLICFSSSKHTKE